MLAFSLAVSLMINRDLSLIFLIAVPVLEAGLYFIVSRSHPYFEKVFHINDEHRGLIKYDCLCNEYFELSDDVITSIGNNQYGKSIM